MIRITYDPCMFTISRDHEDAGSDFIVHNEPRP